MARSRKGSKAGRSKPRFSPQLQRYHRDLHFELDEVENAVRKFQHLVLERIKKFREVIKKDACGG